MLAGVEANAAHTMHLQSILRRVQPLPGFVYKKGLFRGSAPPSALRASAPQAAPAACLVGFVLTDAHH
jgi:hypothetical protein